MTKMKWDETGEALTVRGTCKLSEVSSRIKIMVTTRAITTYAVTVSSDMHCANTRQLPWLGGLQCTTQSSVLLTRVERRDTERHPTSHSEALPRAALRARVRTGLGSRVAGSWRASAARPGRQLFHSLPQQSGLDAAVGKEGERAAHALPKMQHRAVCTHMKHRYDENLHTGSSNVLHGFYLRYPNKPNM